MTSHDITWPTHDLHMTHRWWRCPWWESESSCSVEVSRWPLTPSSLSQRAKCLAYKRTHTTNENGCQQWLCRAFVQQKDINMHLTSHAMLGYKVASTVAVVLTSFPGCSQGSENGNWRLLAYTLYKICMYTFCTVCASDKAQFGRNCHQESSPLIM